MNKLVISVLLGGVLLAGCSRQSELPVREFFKNPECSAYRISPNGALISFLKPSGGHHRLNLFVQQLPTGQPKCVSVEEDRDIWPYYFWKGNDCLVYFVHVVGNPTGEWRVKCVDLKGNDVQDHTPPRLINIIDQLHADLKSVLLVVGGDVVKLDVTTGAAALVEHNPGDVQQWITDQNGNVRAAIARDGTSLCLETRSTADGPFCQVLNMDFRESISPKSYNFGEDEPSVISGFSEGKAAVLRDTRKGNEILYALSNMSTKTVRDRVALVRIDAETGEELSERYANVDFDVSDLELSTGGQVACARFVSWKNERKCLSKTSKRLYGILTKRFPKDDVQIIASDDAGAQLIVQRSSDQIPGEYYLFSPTSGSLKKLGDYAPQLNGRLAKIQPISFTSRYKQTINGYLTLPLGRKSSNLPLIVVPHGGPWGARDVWGFSRQNREIQFFANRGYAVLQVNFRGTCGYGRGFLEAGFKQWGRAMQDDLTDGVLWAINQKIADPKRIALVGESYGGYAALAGIAFTREVHYAAAVDRAGISNLPLLFDELQYSPAVKELAVKIGDPAYEQLLLDHFSPALHCDRIHTPLLIAHGWFDRQVLPEQSIEMRDALVKQGIQVPIQWLPEGHIFENEESLFTYYEAVDGFLKKYLR